MISLSAEQKSIEGMFCQTTETYIIPPYQRPYSWGNEQCYQLYQDLMDAFEENEPYFVGNVILARNKKYDLTGESSVVDGQQRLITIWNIIKVLSMLMPELNSLRSALYVEPWEGNENLPKIKSNIFENDDNKALEDMYALDKETTERRLAETTVGNSIVETKCSSAIEYSLLLFYQLFTTDRKFQEQAGALNQFAKYLMKKVSMLPIVQTADEEKDAIGKALTIFETINNRGMDLGDADIFKARLYESAYKKGEREDFVAQWVDFKSECNAQGYSIDDIFRFYSHIIRGNQKITSGEKKLREFFTNESFSPLLTMPYDKVLGELNKILSILKYIKSEGRKTKGISPWLQILKEYSNQYPIYAIVVYLYHYDVESDDQKVAFVTFLQSLARYCLYSGATTSVKFGIYNIIRIVSFQNSIDTYQVENITADYFDHLGRLKNAYALLAYHLETKSEIPTKYSIDKIVNLRDEYLLGSDWQYENLNDICNSIGNLVVLDIPKRYNSLKEKARYYKTSNNSYVVNAIKETQFGYSDWVSRNRHFKNLLLSFFKK